MHPTYVSDSPGDCPICGMRLVAITDARPPSNATDLTALAPKQVSDGGNDTPAETTPQGLVAIDVDEVGLRLAGVRTQLAERGAIERTIHAAGVVRPDETRVRHVHTKVTGWVEKLFVNFTGEPVRKGQPILTLYSQELLASQQEYLRAREAAKGLAQSDYAAARQGADDMQTAARRRLELFDVPASFMTQLDRSGVAQRTVTLLAPASGIVTGKQAFEGHQVDPGMELFTVSDLSHVWIEADVFENEANAVHVGDKAKISLPYESGAPVSGVVKYIYPYLNPDTRTLKVRFEFLNPGLKLKLDAYLNVDIPVQSDQGVIIADSAILDTGLRRIVFVTTRPGHFEPREVKVGIASDGRAQILSGVHEGEAVAIKANFLLDSESRLRAALVAPLRASPSPVLSAAP
jgi:membrane fusion protein, copper/silver efflux system